jgi:rhodanese-related sulfurtransferase
MAIAPIEVDVKTAAQMLGSSSSVQMLDVRETWERDLCQIAGSIHIPMNHVPSRTAEMDNTRPLLVICHHGGRSMSVTNWLRANGFSLATNVAGGIHEWAMEIDREMAQY